MKKRVMKEIFPVFLAFTLVIGMYSQALLASFDEEPSGDPAPQVEIIPEEEDPAPEPSPDPNEKKAEFVEGLYLHVLGRKPEESEIAYWVDKINSGETATSVAICFLDSEEFRNKGLNDHGFVVVLYHALLERDPSEKEVSFWTDILDRGRTRYFLISGFVNSQEFANLCSAFGIEKGTYESQEFFDLHPLVSGFVARLYLYCLERRYDDSGLRFWMEQLMNGTKGGLEVAQGFFGSEEFKNRALDNEHYVRSLYNTLLEREPDDAGLVFWLQKLSSGEMDRDKVLECFCTSDEFKAICASFGIEYSIPEVRVLYPEACAILDQVGWDLRSAYNWSVGITYVRSKLNQDYGSRYLAHLGFTTRQGNCFVYAATFYEMALALGYDAHQMVGGVLNLYGGLSPHSWVEIDMEGTTYVFDPEFEQTRAGRDGWKFHYGRKNTWVYREYYRLN